MTNATYRVASNMQAAPIQERLKLLRGEGHVYGTTLVAILGKHFDSFDWFDWEPDVLDDTLFEELKIRMPARVRDRLWAMVTALSTDAFYRDPVAYSQICTSLAGSMPSMQVFEPADLDEVAWGTLEVLMSDVEDGEPIRFSSDIGIYVGQLLTDAGLDTFPPLEFALNVKTPALPDTEPDMIQAWVEGRMRLKQDILGDLETNVRSLHQQLRQCGLVDAGKAD